MEKNEVRSNAHSKYRCQYIRNQLQEDCMLEQITLKEYIDTFTGSKKSKA